MQPNTQLPKDFISVDEACELIKSDSRANPVVDVDWMILKTIWIETGRNFRIPKIRRLKEDEVYKTRRGKIVDYEETGSVYVYVATNFEKELLKKTIYDKYRELTGHDYKERGVRGISTVADDAEGRQAVQPRVNRNPIAKEGASIGNHGITTTNGQGISV